MNNRGQFSIVAALFVAVILIGTVIITYSTIRNSPIQSQPQLLSAVDETNLALKQILGFTVGYYGSVLKVTGNTSYARTLAVNYLRSGLVNVGNMHPEWGTSFYVDDTGLQTKWFMNSSFSMGNLAVTYNLTELGINGISYDTQCKLMVEVAKTSVTQACLTITKDDNEPLVNLGKSNFKFYRYVSASSTWELVSPSIEPVALANGTYIIDIPSGVDPYSYAVQVEDGRGIIVVASSFSQYIVNLSWNQQNQTKYAVAGSHSAILGAPDMNYATLTPGTTQEVTDYQGGSGAIKKVYFNITYYGGSAAGTLEWYYQLDAGVWNKIEDLLEGGSAASPLRRTYNATALRASWTWNNVNTTHVQFKNNFNSQDAFVDAIYVTVVYDLAGDYSTIQNATIVGELLQSGSIRWLGQNLQLTTTAKPIPPVPVKGIHVNQTIGGISREVPFQIEDWTSEYKIPLGLTSNASVFNSRSMLVFLANSKVSKVTVWWNGSDLTKQTPFAYANRYFTGDNPNAGVLTNGILTLNIDSSGSNFNVKSTVKTTENTARFMRINNEWSIYGSDPAYTIHHGIVRDIVQAESEWSGNGAPNSPNVYSQVVLTLPANVTYYTYQLGLMFVNSQQSRTINDICPIRITALTGSPQTEDGTTNGFPIVTAGPGTFYNSSTSTWTHRWSQMISGTKGAGIMFTTSANTKLYAFDTIAAAKTGAMGVYSSSSNRTIHLLPVTLAQVQFTSALDVIWCGAVVTFDATRPIYTEDSSKKTGLWITVEYPPIATVTTGN